MGQVTKRAAQANGAAAQGPESGRGAPQPGAPGTGTGTGPGTGGADSSRMSQEGASASGALWSADNPEKKWTETFFLLYSPVWVTWALGIIVPFGYYHSFKELEYLYVGLGVALPCVLLPIFLQPKWMLSIPWYERYWVKANVWIAIFSHIGNYFWTHYFFGVLGAAYTFPSWTLNQIPIPLYLLTHAYFCLYHTLSNLTMRRLHRFAQWALPQATAPAAWGRGILMGAWVFVLAYITAFMETLTISNFDYYTFVDKSAMYTWGSLFYAIYFFVSFPLFFRIDEEQAEPKFSLGRVIIDSLGAGMLVTILLDVWRLVLGPIVDIPGHSASAGACASAASKGLAWA